jgi:hypothetical protein
MEFDIEYLINIPTSVEPLRFHILNSTSGAYLSLFIHHQVTHP